MNRHTLAVLAGVAALLAGCGKDAKGPEPKPPEEHSHPPPPHGGELLELGNDEYHLELIHDHDGGHVTVYVLGKDVKTPVPVEAPVVNLEKGPVQFTLTAVNPGPDGKADTWKGSHEGLRTDPWLGRIRVKIGDKTYQSPLEGELHSHD
jgi:predicted small lipoprotein YifL